ncbi:MULTISPECIES: 23S rRNA (guanosine(2251)-2'-O)-methyltransferase RlmB [Duncaniella]|uniref:23S rRNA (Guanosine(2251)-2'-O)-methyltransferase RlmB n=1 Tax=Duncaniella dubosii TaxID=2518971 RepID=A0A4P7W0K4_9BACT|nr:MULTISPECIES: 23S rRNA (guanosine(2251)-2'-O)-methyltransferase RlmB [Duncaniella]QCD40860.1 23S rRNA (guanosine(2251)-2'-O)-methyltransferase RlmB [Duncaniella dubosii]HBN64301.1 23S rRNA (guanosine(2251)-2'-O)-methyltransferase RlmB [Porphyromonadaceae bacterium]
MEKSDYIYGLRAVIEAIEAGKEIDKIFMAKDLQGDLASELIALARANRVVMQRVPVERINRITRKNHQGVLAMMSAITYHRLDHLVPELYEAGILPFIVILDGITDVRNFGAIARTCECAGVDAIVIPEHGSVSVGGDAVKTSAGALHHIPVCRVSSAAWAAKFLRENGYNVVAVTEKSDMNYTEGKYSDPVAIVMGAEDVGISPEVMKQCDTRVGIPMFGNIGSLNVSVAAGVMIYEVVRQRLASNLEII